MASPAATTTTTTTANVATKTHERPPPNPEAVEIVKLSGGKPDVADNTAKLEQISQQIDQVQKELNQIRSLLSGAGPSKDSPAGIRRTELRAQLDELRNKQAGNKGSRGKVLDELKALQDGIAKKIKDLQAVKSKVAFKSVADVESRIARLEQQVESGGMKLVEEKKALSEISSLKKSRKTVEGFAALQSAIDADRAEVDKLKASLDDPESKAINKKYDEIKEELDEIQKEQEKAAGSRGKLLDQRTSLSAQLDSLYQQRRDRQAAFRAANDSFYQKLNAERERRMEKQRAERAAVEDSKKKELEEQMREEASLPAFAKEIEDCDVLINFFATKLGSAPALDHIKKTEPSQQPKTVYGKALNIRQVNANDMVPNGAVVRKKNEEEDTYFVGSGGKQKKNKKQSKKGTPLSLNDDEENKDTSGGGVAAGTLNVPLGTLSALLALSIPPPTNTSDVARVVENLQLKKQYFSTNQQRVTRENVERVEKMLAKSSIDNDADDKKEVEEDKEEKEEEKEVVNAIQPEQAAIEA